MRRLVENSVERELESEEGSDGEQSNSCDRSISLRAARWAAPTLVRLRGAMGMYLFNLALWLGGLL